MRWAWAFGFALVALGSGSASAINTFKIWDGQQSVSAFGCPDTTTYGQVIKVHRTAHRLNSFTFSLATLWSDHSPAVVRGEVYAWDGSKAAGPSLYESEPRTISYEDSNFHKETFRPTMLTLVPGQYILFLSTAVDYEQEQCLGEQHQFQWGAVNDSAYKGGTFFYQNNIGDEGAWTTYPWHTLGTRFDLAFKADLSP